MWPQALDDLLFQGPRGDTALLLCKGHTVSRDFIRARGCPHTPGGNPHEVNQQPARAGQRLSLVLIRFLHHPPIPSREIRASVTSAMLIPPWESILHGMAPLQ